MRVSVYAIVLLALTAFASAGMARPRAAQVLLVWCVQWLTFVGCVQVPSMTLPPVRKRS